MILTSTILGSVTGLLGNLATAFLNARMQKLKNRHELEMRKIDIAERKAEADLQMRIEESRTAKAIELAEAHAFNLSQKFGNKTLISSKAISKLFDSPFTAWLGSFLIFLQGLIDSYRAAIRPLLTTYFVVLTSWLTYEAVRIISLKESIMPVEMAQDVFLRVLNIIIYLTTTLVLWWFGDRRTAKFLYRLEDGNKRDK
ncbi:hypothetical protein [Persicobacter diffluens]|uniref:Uncharacterized protein n=1 Tax=Persicobacter diffluens TaxID=981 RepID=A0AAN4W384_9BACT|nr:hypothetical protein PEDI_54560 [Persicobacter diffluens]